jgi:threonine dehydrogenase-like Zn-dependent dehydrogenase
MTSAAPCRAIVLEAPRQFRAATFPVPETGEAEFLLEVEMVTICGGDVIEFEGRNRKARYPLILGHELVGRVARIGSQAAARLGVGAGARVSVEPYIGCGRCAYCRRGDYHFCSEGLVYGVTVPADRPPHLWGAYAEYLYGAPGARVHPIGEDVPAPAACLTSVVGNAVRWIRTRGRARVGEPVLIVGGGVQGLASTIVAHEAGLGPIVVVARGRNPRKVELAHRFGASAVVDPERDDVQERIADALGALPLELAVECTGAQPMIDLALEALGMGGRLVQAGTRGGAPVSIDLDALVFKEIDLVGGLGQAGDTELAARIVNSGRYPIEEMVTHTFPLARTEEAMKLFKDGRDGVIHVALDPRG